MRLALERERERKGENGGSCARNDPRPDRGGGTTGRRLETEEANGGYEIGSIPELGLTFWGEPLG